MEADSTDVSPEAASGSKNPREHHRARWPAPVTAALVALTCLRIPQRSLNTGIDDSWGGVLVYAHEKGLQFGRDIAFTYGPLGIFSISGFSPTMALPRLLYEVLLCSGIAAGVCLVAWRMTLGWRALLLGYFLLIAAPIHWGGDDLLIDLGLLCWGLLCWLESGHRLKVCVLCLLTLAAVCALIKFTLLIVACMTIATVACDLALRGRRGLAAGITAGFVLIYLAGWIALGQSLAGLGPYLRNSLAVASGYNLAMGLDRYPAMGGFVVLLTAFAAVIFRVRTAPLPNAEHVRLRRGLLLAWLAGLLFLEWKYGFVRADEDHASCFLGFVPMVALALAAVPPATRRAELWERTAAAGCVLLAMLFLSGVVPGFLLKDCQATLKRLGRNTAALCRPANYVREQSIAYREEQTLSQLPECRRLIGYRTTDVFGYRQMFAVYNELNYVLRPVFQSYSVYNRALMELNGRFYDSSNAPEYVLFSLAAIDARFPPMEDAFVLRNLLFNYQLEGAEGDFLVLHRTQAGAARLKLVSEGDVSPDGVITLGEFGDANLWMEIDLQPTWLGELRRVLYKPAEAKLGVWSGLPNEPGKAFLAPACMLSAGFLASPLVLDNHDVANLYQGKALIRPTAIAVRFLPSPVDFWQEKIHYRIYRIENKLGG
jgi:hypothetical protein